MNRIMVMRFRPIAPKPNYSEKREAGGAARRTKRKYVRGGGRKSLQPAGSRAAKTWITVECVTEIYAEGDGGGASDRDRISRLQADTCPGFVSDGSNKVVWVNDAYRKLNGVVACFLVKHKLPYLAPSFACRLTVTHQTTRGHQWNTIVPCDVSRMDFPGFAWKLDLNTALGLRLSQFEGGEVCRLTST